MAADRAAPRPPRPRRPVLLGLAAALVALVVGAVLYTTATAAGPAEPEEALAEFARAVNAGDVDGIHALMCRQLRDAVPPRHIAEQIRDRGNPQLTDVRTATPERVDDAVRIDVAYVFGGRPGDTTVELVDEDGWRLCDGSWVAF